MGYDKQNKCIFSYKCLDFLSQMLEFSDKELELFEIIKSYALTCNPIVTPRLAGGFVRDKLLKIHSHDIDIALDNMSGFKFSVGLGEFLNSNLHVHKISANPEKSKHLETAVLHIMGYSIDFVNLRNEKYADSRIPVIQPGTPEEDSLRRDITINSLFYNLLTEEIEDFTQRGLLDIINKKIDTPLDPSITLLEDPLRILRIFRFFSRFQFKISDRIYKTLSEENVKKSLETKVSNERIGIEIIKMLDHANGYTGLLEIERTGYIAAIFKPRLEEQDSRKCALTFFNSYMKIIAELKYTFPVFNGLSKKNHEILLLYMILQRFISCKSVVGKKMEYVNSLIMKDSLKTSKEYFSSVDRIEKSVEIYKTSEHMDDLARVVVLGDIFWLESLIILFITTSEEKYKTIIFSIFKNNLMECWAVVPKINGNFLLGKDVQISKFKFYLFESKIIQINNPGSDSEEIYLRVKNLDLDTKII